MAAGREDGSWVIPVAQITVGKVKEQKGTSPGFPAPPLGMALHRLLEAPWEHRFRETQVHLSRSVSLGQGTKPFFTLFSSLAQWG